MFGMGILQQFDYIAYVKREGEKHSSAEKLGLKECQRCGYCCLRRPCVPRPSEVETIAKFLGLSTKELISKYLAVDSQDGTNYFLRWIKHGQEDLVGRYVPADRTFDEGYCALFDKEKKTCLIYSVRPKEARETNCWEEEKDDKEILGANAWGKEDIYRFIPNFSIDGEEENEAG